MFEHQNFNFLHPVEFLCITLKVLSTGRMSDRIFVHGRVKEKTKASGVASGENHLTFDLQSKESCEMSPCVNIMQKTINTVMYSYLMQLFQPLKRPYIVKVLSVFSYLNTKS